MLQRFLAWLKRMVVLMAVLAAAGYFLYSTEWFQKNYIYPFGYQEIVRRYALEYNVSPYLVAAVIRTESKFNPYARSPKGATGLMQLMPDTASWIATQLDYPGFQINMMTDPEVNIRFGTWYLASLRREFGSNDILVLAAYNGGRGNVAQWISKYGWAASFDDINQIPFRETREYVGKVLRDEKKYRELYGR